MVRRTEALKRVKASSESMRTKISVDKYIPTRRTMPMIANIRFIKVCILYFYDYTYHSSFSRSCKGKAYEGREG